MIMSRNIMDLGCITKPSMTTLKEVCDAIDKLDNGQKYKLLAEHFKLDASFSFPKTFSSGCNRSFQYRWLEKYPWLVYSKQLDGGFCKFCAIFARNRETLGVLVNKPFTNWVKVNNVCERHATNGYHIRAVEAGLDFQRSIEQPQLNIDARMNTHSLIVYKRIAISSAVVQSVFFTVGDSVLPSGETVND